MKVLPIKLTDEMKALVEKGAQERGIAQGELARLSLAKELGLPPETFSLVRGKYKRNHIGKAGENNE